MVSPSKSDQRRWIRVDLHIHTPASEDYAEPNISFLDILREAERRELEIIAFTDHNTVAGYERMRREIEFLEQLVHTQRANSSDQQQLDEFHRLLDKITVLPGFEFTSHYGAHVLGIFDRSTPIAVIEATLLQLGVPAAKLKSGSTSVPDTRHVTDAYEVIARAGGMVIAAHANGPGGVISETLRMGTSGQSRIAATQSPSLHAIEFINFYTDHGTFTNPAFYNGRTEHYERPMFCIQGSDAHRVRRAPRGTDATHKHGIGDRYFEASLLEPSFAALKELFGSTSFDLIRVPKRDHKQWDIDQLRFGQASERHILRRTADDLLVLARDVAALSNAGGGTLIIGAAGSEPGAIEGVDQPNQLTSQLRAAIEQQIEPQPTLSFELLNYEGRDVVRVEISATQLPPYVSRDGVLYVRRDNETVPATRGEMIQLARRALAEGGTSPLDNGQELELPRSGVEIVDAQRRNGEWLYEIRDLRTTPGVSRDRAQGLWQYAIARHEDLREGRLDLYGQVRWVGRLGLLRAYQQAGRTKYDLVHRDANGVIDHVFYGVSDWGLSDSWSVLLADTHASNDAPAESATIEAPSTRAPVREAASGRGPEPLTSSEPPMTRSAANRKWRWQGRGGLWRSWRDTSGQALFHLAMRHAAGDDVDEFLQVPRQKLSDNWLRMIRVQRPRTGIEVVSDTVGDDRIRRISFRDLRNGEVSAPWRVEELKEGSVREYAARMHEVDRQFDEHEVRWWGNIGFLRPMRSQVDLVYRDEDAVDHIFYAARRDELRGEWARLLDVWADDLMTHEPRPQPIPAAVPPMRNMAHRPRSWLGHGRSGESTNRRFGVGERRPMRPWNSARNAPRTPSVGVVMRPVAPAREPDWDHAPQDMAYSIDQPWQPSQTDNRAADQDWDTVVDEQSSMDQDWSEEQADSDDNATRE